jgi:hypothetical protein
MGSPELTKMADFVGRPGARDRRSDRGHGCGCDPRSAWPGLGPGLNDPALGRCSGAPATRYGRRDRRDAVVAIAGIALTDRPAGGSIARLSAPARLTGPPTGAWAHSRQRKKRESHVRCHLY